MATTEIEQQHLLIGGEWREAARGATFERRDPFTGDAVSVAAAGGRADAEQAADAAAAACPEWSSTPPGRRREVLAGGDANGNLISPTVLAGVTPEMRIYGEESFGPVVAIVPVDGDDEAVAAANDTEYGLAAAVFGEDSDHALEIARRIESGICHVNSSTVHDEPQMPFGGVKASGWGRFGGSAALEEFTELRWISVQQTPRHYPI
jgi:acyl-CoA reductase-like NAD-dependent aldehyde dehydrogenase